MPKVSVIIKNFNLYVAKGTKHFKEVESYEAYQYMSCL